MKTGITFKIGNKTYHSFTSFGLRMLADVDIPMPEPQLHLISDIPGVDGVIDVTESFGKLRYKNRILTMRFDHMDGSYDEWCKVCSDIANAVHGRFGRVVLDVDPDYYYEGRICVIPETKDNLAMSDLTITVDAFPYKIKVTDGSWSGSVNTGTTVVLGNDSMPSSPIVTTDAQITVAISGNDPETFEAGTYQMDAELVEGNNAATISGTANVSIRWRKGRL